MAQGKIWVVRQPHQLRTKTHSWILSDRLFVNGPRCCLPCDRPHVPIESCWVCSGLHRYTTAMTRAHRQRHHECPVISYDHQRCHLRLGCFSRRHLYGSVPFRASGPSGSAQELIWKKPSPRLVMSPRFSFTPTSTLSIDVCTGLRSLVPGAMEALLVRVLEPGVQVGLQPPAFAGCVAERTA